MEKVSLTTFVNFVLEVGFNRVTIVREAKGSDYSITADYWKRMREVIVRYFREGQSMPIIEDAVHNAHESKSANFKKALRGFKKFTKQYQNIHWEQPPSLIWPNQDQSMVGISVNPELLLTISGQTHLVKLYFKADSRRPKISKERFASIAYLMSISFPDLVERNVKMSILDVTTGRIITPEFKNEIEIMLNADYQVFVQMWNSL